MAEPQLPELKIEAVERKDPDVTHHGITYTFAATDKLPAYTDTLWDEWSDKPEEDYKTEMERRYHNWVEIVTPKPEPDQHK